MIALEKKCKEKYAKKDDLEAQELDFDEKIRDHNSQIDKLNNMIEMLNENLSKDIHTAVRKVAKQMESQSNIRKQPIKNRII